MKTGRNLGIGLAAVMMIGTAQAAILYWDPNTATAGFGGGGTWGTNAFWTTDNTGAFSDGGVLTTASGDVVFINQGNVASFAMGVTGNVHAHRMVIPSTASPVATINGAGSTIHAYASGLGDANAVVGGGGDQRYIMNPNLVLAATVGSTVTLGTAGGNNGSATYNGSITSANTVNMLFGRSGALSLNGTVNLQGGDFLSESGGTFRPKHHTVADGVLGSGVHHVYRSGPQGGHASDKGRLVLGANQAYTGDTFLADSIIRLLAGTSLPITTTVFMTDTAADGSPLMELNFSGINDISGLYFLGVEQSPGTWGAIGNGLTDFESSFFIGSGVLQVIPEPGTMSLVGLVGLGIVARRRRRRSR